MTTFFVDGTAGASLDGRANVTIALAGADWTESSRTLTETGAFSGYTFAAGDVIFISGGTGATVDAYEVESKTDNDNIVLKATSAIDGVGDGDDFAAGDISTSDIVTPASPGPYDSIDDAFSSGGGAAGSGDTVYVKASGTYNETFEPDQADGTLRGYTSVPGDGGKITIDGASSRSSAVTNSSNVSGVVLENLIVTGHTSHGVNTGGGDGWLLRNGRSHTNGGAGIFGDNNIVFDRFTVDGNTGAGIDVDNGGIVAVCRVHDNGGDQIVFNNTGSVSDTEVFGVGSGDIAIDIGGSSARVSSCKNVTIDGEGNGTGLALTDAGALEVRNNIFYDLATGVSCGSDPGRRMISTHNLLNSNTTDYSNWATHDGEVTSAPSFTDESAHDYTLQASSPAVDAGIDAGAL